MASPLRQKLAVALVVVAVVAGVGLAACAPSTSDAAPGPKELTADGGVDTGVAPGARCTATTCSGHGACSDTSGVPTCTCEPGYGGADCSTCAPGPLDPAGNPTCATKCAPTTCNGHGTCNDGTGTAACTCEAAYGGITCDTCAPSFQDKNGDKICAPACAPESCSGHGACNDASGAVACACDAEYAGPACATCAVNFQDKDNDKTCKPACVAGTCSGHGACADATGTAVCSCTGNFTGPACATCATGFTGAACDTCVAGKYGPRCDYGIVYGLNIPTMANYDVPADVPYDIDNSAVAGAFTRVAYRLVLDAEEVWVEMDAFTATKASLGLPVDAIFDSTVITNVTVVSKAANVGSIAAPLSGTLEFWSHCYGTAGGNGAVHDYKDAIIVASPDCYGSMQVHIGMNTIIAYNRWSGAGVSDMGFGNGPATFPDWTGANNATSFATRRLEVFVK